MRGFASIPIELIPYIGDSDEYTMMGVCREWGCLEDDWRKLFLSRNKCFPCAEQICSNHAWNSTAICPKRGCTYLDDNGQPRNDYAKRSIALMEAGHRQLLDFLATVWGVGPVTEDEVRRWGAEMEAPDKALIFSLS